MKFKMWLWMLFFSVLTGMLLWRLFGTHQMWDQNRSIKQRITEQHAKNTIQMTHNQIILNDINRLKSNPQSVETEARQSLGMIKQDELFYQIIPRSKRKDPA